MKMILKGLNFRDKLFRLVRPRPDWVEIDLVRRGLAKVLRKFDALGLECDELDDLIFLLEVKELEKIVCPESRGKVEKGLKTKYPQHAALIKLGGHDDVSPQLLELAALIIVAVQKWDIRIAEQGYLNVDVEDFSNHFEQVWRQVRLITEKGIKQLPEVSNDIESFYNDLNNRLNAMDKLEKKHLDLDFQYL